MNDPDRCERIGGSESYELINIDDIKGENRKDLAAKSGIIVSAGLIAVGLWIGGTVATFLAGMGGASQSSPIFPIFLGPGVAAETAGLSFWTGVGSVAGTVGTVASGVTAYFTDIDDNFRVATAFSTESLYGETRVLSIESYVDELKQVLEPLDFVNSATLK